MELLERGVDTENRCLGKIRKKDRMVNTGVSLDTSDEVVIKGVTPGD